MRLDRLAAVALTVVVFLGANGCTSSTEAGAQPGARGKGDSAGEQSFPFPLLRDECAAGCEEGSGCMLYCQDRAFGNPEGFEDGFCTRSCEIYNQECTGTQCPWEPTAFCPGEEDSCQPIVPGQAYACNSFVLTNDNPKHCGGCNTNCVTCDSMQCTCAGSNGIVNLAVDAKNCGACGNACAEGEECALYACRGRLLCPVPLPAHLSGGFGSDYVNPLTDAGNCGECGNVCSSGSCVNGACTD